jgi:tetratricopeptide (TPR) repeat protein
MNKIILLLVGLFSVSITSFAQVSNDKIMFVIDSIPVIDDPEEGNEISQTDIADITVIKNKDTLNRLGYGQFDGVTFLFTKEYRNRPDGLKQIPSSKQMEKKNGVWLFYGAPYNGRFIDYYYSGRKQGEGTFVEGKINGLRTIYYQNGEIEVEKNYKGGLENGLDKEYYEDGTLSQKGEFKNGKEEGIWENYFPNGQVKLRGNYHNGEIFDTATKYYSNGKIKEKVFIKNDKAIPDPNLVKINQLMNKSNESSKEGDTKAAIKYCSKAIELDSTFADAYFSRGTLKLNDFQFDNAIADFDKALQFEPYMDVALANRAFARIRKYQFGNSRTLSKNDDVAVLASK